MNDHPQFLDLGDDVHNHDRAFATILPIAYERTTSYGQGTKGGPEAILTASAYIETYDEELGIEACEAGVSTQPELIPEAQDLAVAIAQIESAAHQLMTEGKFVVTLGGEHAVTLGPVRAAQAVFGELGVLQFDAHADLRDTYEGSPYSHACVMRRIVDLGLPTAAIGLRALSPPEASLINERGIQVIWGHQIDQAEAKLEALLASLPPRIYLTFDLDYLDPSILPATGTPEPGGGLWYPTLRLLRRIFETKEVVAMDVVELAPIAGQPASDFLAAKLVYKCFGYAAAAAASS